MNALSFGQLSVLRNVEQIPVDRRSLANIAYWLELRPGLTVQEVRAALELLPRRHASLRTRYRLPAGGTPTQWVEEHAHGVLKQAEIDGTPEAAAELVETSRERLFTLEDDFGWEATIATTGGRPRGIAMNVHHIAADGWAQGILVQDLAPVLADPEPAAPAGAGDTIDSPIALALEQRSVAWRELRQQARRYHGDVLRSGLLAPVPPAPAGRALDLPPRIDGELSLHHLVGALVGHARDMRVLPQALLLAAATVTSAVSFGELSHAWWLQSSNRFDPRWTGLVTSMNQPVPMRADLTADLSVTELAQKLQADSFAALRHGSYDVDEINGLAEEAIGGLPHWKYMFNYAVTSPLAVPADDRPLDRIPPAEPHTATSHRSTVATCYFMIAQDPALTLRYCTTRRNSDEQQVAAMLRTYEAVLRRIMLSPDQPVRRLLDTAPAG